MNASTPSPASLMPMTLESFDPASGSWAERLLFNYRWVVMLLCLLATLGLGWQSTQVGLQASFERMLPSQHPYIKNYLAHKEELKGLSNALRIGVEATEADSIFEPDYMETLRQLNDEVFALPGVDRAFMKSLWTPSARWLGVTEEGLEGGQIIPEGYDGSPEAIEQLRMNVSRSGEIGQIVARDFKSSIIFVPLLDRDAAGMPLDYGQLSVSLEELRAKYEAKGVRLYITGFGKLVGDLLEGLQQVLMFFAVAIAICTVMLYGYTRCLRSTLLVVACSLVAVLWLLGLLALLGLQLDPYSILVPFLVFAIGMSHGAQKMNGIMQDIGRGAHRWVAARYTFRRLFLAGLTALLADAVGFAVLLIIDIPVIKDLALTASLGVALLIFTNLVLLPILLSYTGVSPAAAMRSLREERANAKGGQARHAVWAFLDLFTQRRAATYALYGAAILGAAGFLVSLHLKIGDLDPGAPELRPDSRYNLDNAFITGHYAASSDIFVVMVRTKGGECSKYETLIKVDALEWRLQQLPGVESTLSFASLTRRALAGLSEGNLKWAEIQRNQGSINAVIPRAPLELFNSSCDLLSLFVYLRDHKAETLESVVQAVQQFADANDGPDVRFLMAAGNSGIDAATNIVVKRANLQMLLLVYAAVTVLSFISFRSWRAVLCAVVPLALTSVLCEALMVGLGIGVKVATLPVIALGVGIGVDYALYVLSITLAGLRAGQNLSEAYYRALLFTGKVVVLTGVTLGIAVATWFFSPIKFQADMGILLAFMFIGNMIGALVLLPALGHFLLRSEDFRLAHGAAVPRRELAEVRH
ncbi:efflux RND transporter permease subunit [Pseudomonas putida]|uniref:MMPL family transporter n=1 Tax=Pseudomonas putida TaxID=303 RepID=A0AAW6PWL5_PSEPU|nr:MMPL family transporter [Pseudomonas putida]MDF3872862.1 MMPL family transporter [Pseudomonas putida]MDF3878199.1 MMPL family transporter [Pseudomonas putida]